MADAHAKASNVDQLRQRFEAHGQEHVFRFWDTLDADERSSLEAQAHALDLTALAAGLKRATSEPAERCGTLAPIEVEPLPEHGGDPERRAQAERLGAERLDAGRVAVMVVAGGQATRLGHPGPKGLFPLGPITGRTLFAQQAQKLHRLRTRHAQPIPWLVMTSPATDAATREGFEAANYFGLPREDVFLFSQAMVPSFDFDGHLMLETPGRIFENPNGHGGSLTALQESGLLDRLEARGIDTLFYYQVDNPLGPLADPVFVGFHALLGAEMSCKVIRKRAPDEKVGVVAMQGGRVGVVEYTEIDAASRNAVDAEGDLLYWAGNMAVHTFDTAFLRRVAGQADSLLPYHASAKKIPSVNEQGEPVAPEAPNGHKLERFVFDALGAATRVGVVEVRREEEYSPVKNAEGTDCPETARADLQALYLAWLEASDIALPPNTRLEIDEACIGGPEDLRALNIERVEDAPDAIRTEPGAPA